MDSWDRRASARAQLARRCVFPYFPPCPHCRSRLPGVRGRHSKATANHQPSARRFAGSQARDLAPHLSAQTLPLDNARSQTMLPMQPWALRVPFGCRQLRVLSDEP